MKFTTFVELLVKNNVLIIEVLLGIIIFSVAFLSFRLFFRKAEEEIKGSVDDQALKAIEASLKKVLETSELKASVSSNVSSGGSIDDQFVEKLEQEVSTKSKLIEELQEQLQTVQAQAAASASTGSDTAQWKEKAAELEAKLAEYEIIAEDIADLSQYKEENARLKAEIEALQAGGAVAAPAGAPAPTPVAETAPAAAVDDDIMAEFAKAVDDQKSGSLAEAPPPAPAAVAAAPAPAADPAAAVDDDIMAEFAKAVEEQKSGDLVEPVPEPVATPAPAAKRIEFGSPEEDEAIRAAALAAVAEAAGGPPKEPDPFEAALEAGAAEPEAGGGFDLGTMNLDAMVEEAKDLAEAVVVESTEPPNALEASLDTDKLAEEALTIQKVKPDDEQLMNQFEDFVKKGAS